MLYQFREMMKNQFNAGSKAVFDAREIAAKCGAKTINIYRLTEVDFPFLPKWANRLLGWMLWTAQVPLVYMRIEKGASIFMQCPVITSRALLRTPAGVAFFKRLKARKHLKVYTLLHDILELQRTPDELEGLGDSLPNILSYTDKLIVHNESMRRWLLDYGVPDEKMVTLGIFDYLCVLPIAESASSDFRQVVFAGNLRITKSAFLTQLKDVHGLRVSLYGAKFKDENVLSENVRYLGCLPPDEIPAHLTTGFGLVWDGESIDGCLGQYGKYLEINNPHKLSLYLASGLPVIVWEKSAVAEFVLRHKVGLAVGSLKELPDVFAKLSAEEYSSMRQNACAVAKDLRNGSYLKVAIGRCRQNEH